MGGGEHQMRVLVTGGAGFLGPHIVKSLEQNGHEVVVFDIKEPLTKGEFIAGDLASLDDCIRATRAIDSICHLGGIGDVYLAFEKPYLAASINVQGTANLMEAALRNRVGKVVYASTWEVYGEPRYEPIDEKHPTNPDHPYNITKLAGEHMALAYDHLKGARAVALRLGTAYGQGMRPNSVR
jgi:UDP-glucose 4-epimerase